MAGALLLAAALAAGCGGAGDDGHGGGNGRAREDTAPVAGTPAPEGRGTPVSGTPAAGGPPSDDAVRRAARWGLEPFAPAPAPPAVKPVRGGGPEPVVIDRVPTTEKIVFVTIDDGAEQDPRFIEMTRDLGVPVSMFLNDTYVRQNPEYFRELARAGATVQNHTLNHPNLRTLGAEAQRREICGQQDRLEAVYGTRPTLFRPPYGNWNATTREVAGGCGVGAIVTWRESMQIKNMQYVEADKKLRPGDIILAHFRGPADLKGTTMTEMMGNLYRKIQEQGFTIARLEDYV